MYAPRPYPPAPSATPNDAPWPRPAPIEFNRQGVPSLAPVDGGVLADLELVTPFIETFGTLEQLAVTPKDSIEMIKEAAAAL